jgi:hypothetical protein
MLAHRSPVPTSVGGLLLDLLLEPVEELGLLSHVRVLLICRVGGTVNLLQASDVLKPGRVMAGR